MSADDIITIIFNEHYIIVTIFFPLITALYTICVEPNVIWFLGCVGVLALRVLIHFLFKMSESR